MRHIFAALLIALAALPALAVTPDEMLEDPALEARARDLSTGIRCLVCRSESIDESNADLARDLRVLVRERILAGDTDEEIEAYLVSRYGEYVLLRPDTSGANLLLWAAGPLALLAGLGVSVFYIRRQRSYDGAGATHFSAAERRRLDELTEGEQGRH
ncbi:cytochrome c-type biogenesis protein [Tropicimonas sp. IMCC34011]|uniref:cytochrome c-type biogenesis protein n=1 Tax=Tropicimonas sp. IMCC34011 TaxID=2248759 RepID=UPI000E26C167|nr:cytochrome c-type biogenesis protein [Tropicimonas sp. IMCC34011]